MRQDTTTFVVSCRASSNSPIYDVETPKGIGLSLNMLKNSGFAEALCGFQVETHVETVLRLLSSGFESLRKMQFRLELPAFYA